MLMVSNRFPSDVTKVLATEFSSIPQMCMREKFWMNITLRAIHKGL